MDDEPIEEGELVRIFLRADGIAIRHINGRHPHDAVSGRDDRLDIARVLLVVAARQATRDLDRPLGENGDAVKRLLSVRRDL